MSKVQLVKTFMPYGLIVMFSMLLISEMTLLMGVNPLLILVIEITIGVYLIKHAVDASQHDVAAYKYGEEFAGYDPDIHMVYLWEAIPEQHINPPE